MAKGEFWSEEVTYVIIGIGLLPILWLKGPSWVEYAEHKLSGAAMSVRAVYERKDDMASLVACCNAVCKHWDCANKYLPILCDPTRLEAELDKAQPRVSIKDAKNILMKVVGKEVNIQECE